jgi:transposase InsO family protein
LDLWAYQRGVTLDFSRPGKPTDNAFIESFNGKFRAECLNARCGNGRPHSACPANLDTPPTEIIYLNGLQMVDDPFGGSVRASQARSTIGARYRPVMEEKDAEYFQSLPRRHQDQRSRRDSSFLYRRAGSA